MKDAWEEARNDTAYATSLGFPSLFSNALSAPACKNVFLSLPCNFITCSKAGVSIVPGPGQVSVL